jgi:hypothetical protein
MKSDQNEVTVTVVEVVALPGLVPGVSYLM